MRSECGKLLREAQAEARLGDRSTSKDLLSLLVKANMSDDEKTRLTDEEVMGQVSQSLSRRGIMLTALYCTTFLLAGFETTSFFRFPLFHELY